MRRSYRGSCPDCSTAGERSADGTKRAAATQRDQFIVPALVIAVRMAMAWAVGTSLRVIAIRSGQVRLVAVPPEAQSVGYLAAAGSGSAASVDVIEGQIFQVLDGLVPDHEINWVWLPPWSLALVTPDGREQAKALGLST